MVDFDATVFIWYTKDMKVLEKILGHQITAVSRGRVIVDEDLRGIIPFWYITK